LSTKIHLLCNRQGLPLRLRITAGQIHDVTQAPTLLADLRARYVVADRGYVSDTLRQNICAAGAKAVIPPKQNACVVYAFNKRIYRQRNMIERAINKLKHFRRIATRFEKNAVNFLAMLHLAASHLWLRLIDDTT
jgi:transposase